MAPPRHGRRPGLREVTLLWTLYLVVAAEVFATYSRLTPHQLYHVSGNGRVGGASRALVFLNWPVALAAIPMLIVVAVDARSRVVSRLALVSALLCAAVFWPGMVDQADLDAKWANAIAAIGVLLAFGLTVAVLLRRGLGPRTRAPGDRVRVAVVVLLVLLSVPWLGADLGFLVGRLPLLGSIYYSDEWYAPFGHARMHEAVHAGNHHGLVGALLVVTVLLLSRTLPALPPRPRRFLGAYLAVLGLYGLANILNDFWLEQVVKRGLTDWQFPSMVAPKASLAWLVLLVVAAFLYWLGFRRTPPARAVGDGAPRSPIVATPAVVVLLAVGLAHGSTQTHTRFAVIDGIVFAAAPHGASHLFVTSRGRALQLTDGDGSDVAPAWHRGGEISFVSNRSGGWKRYVMHTDGSGVRLLGDAPPDPAQSWLRHQCRLGNHWHICVNGRYLTTHSSDAFAPAWSPDGKRIAFVSDRDGRDELFVMRADGTDVARITHGQMDIDTPTWTRR